MALEIKHKILVVDDDPDIRRLVETVLEREGFIVGTASNGAEFFKAIPQFRPELVVLDLQLPDEDGFGALDPQLLDNVLPRVNARRVDEHDRQAANGRSFGYGVTRRAGNVRDNRGVVRERVAEKHLALGRERGV